MRRSLALTKTLHFHAVVLHRASCLLSQGEQDEALERLDFMEALCKDTLDTIATMRSEHTDDMAAFAASVEADLSALPVA